MSDEDIPGPFATYLKDRGEGGAKREAGSRFAASQTSCDARGRGNLQGQLCRPAHKDSG